MQIKDAVVINVGEYLFINKYPLVPFRLN